MASNAHECLTREQAEELKKFLDSDASMEEKREKLNSIMQKADFCVFCKRQFMLTVSQMATK